ncbi:MAG: hypothetical protein ABIJ08_04710 [Nanoarchaeota archaeon]
MKYKPILGILIFACLITVSLAYTLDVFDKDNHIYSVDTTIIINEKAEVNSVYTFMGRDAAKIDFLGIPGDATITIDDKSYSNGFMFNPEGETTVVVNYIIDIGQGAAKSMIFNPKTLFDNKINSKKVSSYSIKISSDIDDFSKMSEEYTSKSIENGKNIFRWIKSDIYPDSLILGWNTLGYDLSVVRDMIYNGENIYEIKVILNNKGDVDIKNIEIEDSFMVGDFEGVYPKQEFTTESPDGFDNRLYWRTSIPIIKPGETKTAIYQIRSLNSAEYVFSPLIVRSDSIIIATTKPFVFVEQGSSSGTNAAILATTEKLQAESKQNQSLEDIRRKIFITVVIIIIMSSLFLFILSRRKKELSSLIGK